MTLSEYEERRRDIFARAFFENKERMSPEEWKSWMLHIENVCKQPQKEKKHGTDTSTKEHPKLS